MTAILVKRTSQEINFEWDKGSTFRYSVPWTSGPDKLNQTPVDLTGCTAVTQFRDAQGVLLLELTTANGGMTLGGADGTVGFYISAADLAGFAWNTANYDTDISFSNGDVRKLFRGVLSLFDETSV